MSISTTTGGFQLGAVVRQTLAATKANFLVYFGVALICVALPDALFAYLALESSRTISSGGVVSMIGQSLVQAAVVYGVVAQMNGRRAPFKECLNVAGKLLLPLLAIGILTGLGVAVGLILVIVPGVILICMWTIAAPARVIEGPGVRRAFGRSVELTKGHRWSIFLLILAVVLLIAVTYGVVYAVFSFAGSFVVDVVISPILGAVASVIGAAGSAALYFELRRVKEGVGPESLASVFD